MQNKIEQLEGRILVLNNMLGELNTSNTTKDGTQTVSYKNIMEAINHLNERIKEISTPQLKDANNNYEELAPYLSTELLSIENLLKDEEMEQLIAANHDEIESFLQTLSFLKRNEKSLKLNPILDADEKIKIINQLELKSMTMESKLMKMNDNIDALLKNYNQTIDIINKKFALYNELCNNQK